MAWPKRNEAAIMAWETFGLDLGLYRVCLPPLRGRKSISSMLSLPGIRQGQARGMDIPLACPWIRMLCLILS